MIVVKIIRLADKVVAYVDIFSNIRIAAFTGENMDVLFGKLRVGLPKINRMLHVS